MPRVISIAVAVLALTPVWAQEPIKINSSQILLLKRDATVLSGQREGTQALLADLESRKDFNRAQFMLRGAVFAAMASVKQTTAEFQQLADTDPQKSAGEIFFADITSAYSQVAKQLADLQQSSYASARQVALGQLSRTANAYTVVATNGVLTFDLDVRSVPAEAAVFYRKTGDSNRRHTDPTNTVIRNLIYARWIVQVEKPGFLSDEKEHDPFQDRNHVLIFELKRR